MTEKKAVSVSEAGRRGGLETSRRHGRKFYHEIGKKGGHKVRELVKKGRVMKATRLKKLDQSLKAMENLK